MAWTSFWSGLFGKSRSSSVRIGTGDFIPVDSNGTIIEIGSSANWMELTSPTEQAEAYKSCSVLASVINRIAEADINGELTFTTKEKEPANTQYAKRLQTLFERPNPIQSWDVFRTEQKVYLKIFGYCPVFVVKQSDFLPLRMWNLSPEIAKPNKSDDFSLIDGVNPISSWEVTMFGNSYTIPSEKVLLLSDDKMLDQYTYLPISKMISLSKSISNCIASETADNVILNKRGPLGIFSSDKPPDSFAGNIPMTEPEKKEILDDLNKYGVQNDQRQYVVTKSPLKFIKVSFDAKELMTKETFRQSADNICDGYGYPPELISGKNPTYENKTSAQKFLYNSNIIPSARKDFKEYSRFFKTEKDGFYIGVNYDSLPTMQEDIAKKAEANKFNAEAHEILYLNGIITKNQFLNALGLKSINGGDEYYEQTKTK